MQEQETRTAKENKVRPSQCVTIPWKEWSRSRAALQLDAKDADLDVATLVHRSLHCNGKIADQPVDVAVSLENKQRAATVTEDVEPEGFELHFAILPLGGSTRRARTRAESQSRSHTK